MVVFQGSVSFECVRVCVAYLELNLVIQYEPFSSVYMQLVCEKAGFCLLCVDCL